MAGMEHAISVETDETSRGNDQPIIVADETQWSSIEVPVSRLSPCREKWLEQLEKAREDTAPNEAEKTGPKIQMAPFLLREHPNVAKYFEPRVMSLGPIHHHGKPKYKRAEKYKLGLANKFVKESRKTVESLYKKLRRKSSNRGSTSMRK
jgi:hypothetical protein